MERKLQSNQICKLEYQIIEKCAPTIANHKAANMFSFRTNHPERCLEILEIWNKNLSESGIHIEVLRSICDRSLLIFCVRKSRLERILMRADVKEFLLGFGYSYRNVDEALETLRKRFSNVDSFPHEIGIFLEYPLCDVKGFIEQGGDDYKCCSDWKVYGDAECCEKTFCTYKSCRCELVKKWFKGANLFQLAVAG